MDKDNGTSLDSSFKCHFINKNVVKKKMEAENQMSIERHELYLVTNKMIRDEGERHKFLSISFYFVVNVKSF